MSDYRECFKFWPCGVDLYHDTVWDEWLFFRRQQVKEFKEGHDRDHNTIPLLSEAQVPRLFSFERSQHDNLCKLYMQAIEEADAYIKMINEIIHD